MDRPLTADSEMESSEHEIFARGPVVIFRWRNQPGWPVEQVSPNASEVFGFSAEQFLSGEAVYASLIHPDDLQRVTGEVIHGAENNAASFVHEPYRIIRADGAIRWLYDMTHVIRETAGADPTHFLGYVVDITKQIAAEEEHHALQIRMLQTQKLESLGLLASGVAHDFNNFLTGILGEAELARFSLSDEQSEAGRRLASIEKLAIRAAEVTQQLLTYTGKRQHAAQSFHLDEVVSEVVEMLGTVISGHATLNLDITPVRPIVADRTQISQIVMNLLTNASDSLLGESGLITVRVAEATEDETGRYWVELTVTDSGCGMTDAVQAQLFDPFFTTKDTGRGLGMSSVQGILRAHGGRITVESTLGLGSKFRVSLPEKPTL